MIIKRILNHNAVIAQSKKDIDILLFGRGIAFGRKIGDKVNPIDIEKSFFLKNRDNMTRFTEMFINVPLELVYITEKIINLGKPQLFTPNLKTIQNPCLSLDPGWFLFSPNGCFLLDKKEFPLYGISVEKNTK
ncbi:CAT RNA binding domain-containing protein, partial [Streptococcus pneumoniae]|uniref:CAT RNA binding domain-containing protein n=1 Tax=Streptococcus pneumoniae TaxID=1313 RepID=UPI000AB4C7BF